MGTYSRGRLVDNPVFRVGVYRRGHLLKGAHDGGFAVFILTECELSEYWFPYCRD